MAVSRSVERRRRNPCGQHVHRQGLAADGQDLEERTDGYTGMAWPGLAYHELDCSDTPYLLASAAQSQGQSRGLASGQMLSCVPNANRCGAAGNAGNDEIVGCRRRHSTLHISMISPARFVDWIGLISCVMSGDPPVIFTVWLALCKNSRLFLIDLLRSFETINAYQPCRLRPPVPARGSQFMQSPTTPRGLPSFKSKQLPRVGGRGFPDEPQDKRAPLSHTYLGT